MAAEPEPDSRTRARTRRAILDAAMAVLASNPVASLGDVASAAGVGRSTLHRYFAERSDLVAALGDEVRGRIRDATERARLDEGPALDALGRLMEEYFDLGDALTLLFNEPHMQSEEFWSEETESDAAITRAVERGRADGELDAEFDALWVVYTMWALLYTTWSLVRDNGASRHRALALGIRSLRKAVAA